MTKQLKEDDKSAHIIRKVRMFLIIVFLLISIVFAIIGWQLFK